MTEAKKTHHMQTLKPATNNGREVIYISQTSNEPKAPLKRRERQEKRGRYPHDMTERDMRVMN